jgi:type IV secretion system protein VirB11
LNEYEIDGILTDKSDALNLQRRRDYFLESVRGKRHLEVIRAAIEQRKNILVAGSTGSGKTTFINAVLMNWRGFRSNDRVLIIEDTPELQCNVKELSRVARSRACVDARLPEGLHAVEATRIVVGKCGAEALSMPQSVEHRHPACGKRACKRRARR